MKVKEKTQHSIIKAIIKRIKEENDFAKRKLKPCPFCKEKEGLRVEDNSVYCVSCNAIGPLGIDNEDAINAWNKRS